MKSHYDVIQRERKRMSKRAKNKRKRVIFAFANFPFECVSPYQRTKNKEQSTTVETELFVIAFALTFVRWKLFSIVMLFNSLSTNVSVYLWISYFQNISTVIISWQLYLWMWKFRDECNACCPICLLMTVQHKK